MGRGQMKSSAGKIEMTSFDDLFGVGKAADEGAAGIMEAALSELHPFKGHPFKVVDDDAIKDSPPPESCGKDYNELLQKKAAALRKEKSARQAGKAQAGKQSGIEI